jgi:predicted DNA-binding transcriptional regulator YafY
MPLRRADRLFNIVRVLRAASRPVTAASRADELEVTVRTVYRDIAVPAGAAHPDRGRARDWLCLRRGFELPPRGSPSTRRKTAVGVRMLARTGDLDLQKAAERATLVVPDLLVVSPNADQTTGRARQTGGATGLAAATPWSSWRCPRR